MLKEGTEAFVLFGKESGGQSKSGPRQRLDGAARVRVTGRSHDGGYTTVVVAGSGVEKGAVRNYQRDDLYATPAEKKYFGQLVGWLWSGEPMTMERPALKEETDV